MTDGTGNPRGKLPPPSADRSTDVRLLALSHTGLWSGAERVLLRTVTAASARGWDVTVACPPGPFADRLRGAGLRVVAIGELKLSPGPRITSAPRLLVRWRRTAPLVRHLAEGADVVVVNGLLGLPPVRLARTTTPVAWVVHDSIHRPEWRMLLALVAPCVDLALPVSEAVAGPLRQSGLKVEVVHNGTEWPVPGATPVPPPIIGCAGLLTAWKGQAVLLEALARMRRRDAVVELLGRPFPGAADQRYAAALHERAGRPDLAGRVRMPGFVDDAAERMRRWTVAASPSTEPEACPLAVLEAMSLGLAVVGTDHGGTPEVLGDTGRLVAPGDPDALAAALDDLLDDDAGREALGRAARRRVSTSFTLEAKTDQLLDTVATLVTRERP